MLSENGVDHYPVRLVAADEAAAILSEMLSDSNRFVGFWRKRCAELEKSLMEARALVEVDHQTHVKTTEKLRATEDYRERELSHFHEIRQRIAYALEFIDKVLKDTDNHMLRHVRDYLDPGRKLCEIGKSPPLQK